MHRDAADVRLADVAHAGRRGGELDERLVRVSVGVQRLEASEVVDRLGRSHVAADELALVERHEMRDERDPDVGVGGIQYRELLLDLGDVAVARDAVRVQVLVDGHEVGLLGRGPAGARHARTWRR